MVIIVSICVQHVGSNVAVFSTGEYINVGAMCDEALPWCVIEPRGTLRDCFSNVDGVYVCTYKTVVERHGCVCASRRVVALLFERGN